MKSLETFTHILLTVSRVTEISEKDILSRSRCEEIVDARTLLVEFCAKEGLYPRAIAKYIGCTTRNVNHVLSNSHLRHTYLLELYSAEIRKQLGNN